MGRDMDNEKQDATSGFLRNNNKSGGDLSWRNSLKQVLAACIAHSLVIQVGINLSFSAVLLPQLRESDSNINIDLSQASWIASIVTAALPVGSLIIGPLMDRFGRKKMCILTAIPFLISWMLHNFATSVYYIYVARIVAGFGAGLSTVAMVYVSEISHPKYRPMLLTFNSVFVTLGILITCILGGFGLQWRLMTKIFFAMTCVTLTAIFFIPESPYWLLVFRKDKVTSGKSLKWIYNDEMIYEEQLDRITNSTLPPTSDSTDRSALIIVKENLTLYRQPFVWKPLVILFSIFVFQQLSAAYVVVSYAVNIFRKIGGSFKHIGLIDEFMALILLGTIRFVMAIVLASISKRVKRRILMFVSAAGMIVTSFSTGLYMSLTSVQNNIDNSNSTLTDNIPVTDADSTGTTAVILVLSYICFSSFGWLVIPWTLIGELLPVKVRGVLGGLMISVAYLAMFVMLKVSPFIMESISLGSIFFGLSVINIAGMIFIYFFLPETLGKTFDDIARFFDKQSIVQ